MRNRLCCFRGKDPGGYRKALVSSDASRRRKKMSRVGEEADDDGSRHGEDICLIVLPEWNKRGRQ